MHATLESMAVFDKILFVQASVGPVCTCAVTTKAATCAYVFA